MNGWVVIARSLDVSGVLDVFSRSVLWQSVARSKIIDQGAAMKKE